jgi:hypothetical protein
MIRCTLALACVVAAGGSAAAGAQSYIETFDGTNEGGWAYGGPGEVIETTGGNPGAYLHSPMLDTFAPTPRTTVPGSLFTGDYRVRDVVEIAVDLVTFDVDFSADGRPLTLMLVSDNDTPGNVDDDWAAYLIGPDNIPLVGEGWLSYAFAVPSAETSLPAGWSTIGLGGSSPPNPDWNDVITDVSEVRFFYGDPTFIFIFQVWDVGLDNVAISESLLFADGFESGDTSAWSVTVP